MSTRGQGLLSLRDNRFAFEAFASLGMFVLFSLLAFSLFFYFLASVVLAGPLRAVVQ